VPSALYSFTWAIKPDWSKPYGTQPEILEYLQGVARDFGILPHCRFGAHVTRAVWDERDAKWTLTLESGETLETEVVVSAIGMFNDLAWPEIEGLDRFTGTSFHSARWNWDHDLTGERVAVIGSAASAVQFVPEIVKTAGQVYLFQRTANWVSPKLDSLHTSEQLEEFRADPTPVLKFRDEVLSNMEKGLTFADEKVNAEREAAVLFAIDVVRDPEVRRKLRPTHPFGCKRPLFSNLYYPAFNEPNLELVTDAIECVTEHGVVTVDGKSREVDTIVIATGFATTKYLSAIDVVGRDGVHIEKAWNDGAQAYLGIMTSGFPNLFMIYGPNTNNGSIMTMIEHQVEHIVQHVRRLAGDGIAWVDVRRDVMDRWNVELQDTIANVRVWQADCNGYYRTPNGRLVTQWPGTMGEFRDYTAALDPDAYEVGAR
jgi:cation diffusion facilitator CzcD-associated flavoprotein CzcO